MCIGEVISLRTLYRPTCVRVFLAVQVSLFDSYKMQFLNTHAAEISLCGHVIH